MKSNLLVCGLAALAVAGGALLSGFTLAPPGPIATKTVPVAEEFKCKATDPTAYNGKICGKQCNQAKNHGGMHMDDDFHSW